MIIDDNSAAPHQACASCKHQRRKCQPDCPLAPFFPPEKNHLFQAVQKVFGVSNVMKSIKALQTHEQKQRAINTMCWEAQWRLKNPVDGCYSEFRRVTEELELYKKAFERLAYTTAPAPAAAKAYGGSVVVRPHEVMNAYGTSNKNRIMMMNNNSGGRVGVPIGSNNNNGNGNIKNSSTNIVNPQEEFAYGFDKKDHLLAGDPAINGENVPELGDGNQQTHNQASSCGLETVNF